MEQQEEKKSKKPFIWILLTGILIATNAGTFYLYLKEKGKVETKIVEVEKIVAEKSTVLNDLQELKTQYEGLQTNNASLQKDIDEKKAQIEVLIEEAKKHKGDAAVISKLKKEMETLRQIMQGYVRTIDSLGIQNRTLKAEKEKVIQDLSVEKEKVVATTKEKEELQSTIKKGSILTAFNVTAQGVKFKSNGKKEIETSKAKRTEKIKISFTVGENKIAKSGEKEFIIRVITPDGKEMAKSYDESNQFNFNNSKGYFAGKQSLFYANKEITGVTYCEGSTPLVPGKYIIEVNADGVTIGSSTLTLE